MSIRDRDDVAQFQPMPVSGYMSETPSPDERSTPAARQHTGTVPPGALASDADVERVNGVVASEHRAQRARGMVSVPAPTPLAPPTQHVSAPGLDTAGELGADVSDVLQLDRIDATARKVRARIDNEARAVAEANAHAVDDHTAALLDEAWTAGAAKARVPEIVERSMTFIEHTRLRTSASYEAERLVEAVALRMATEAGNRVRDTLDEVDALVLEAARSALVNAAQATERLTLAGLTVDATDSELVDLGDAGALSAKKLWRSAVSSWVEVQAVRQWVAAVLDRGFRSDAGKLALVAPAKVRSGAYALDADTTPPAEQVAAAGMWQTQGSRTPVGVPVTQGSPSEQAHAALRGWCALVEAKRPAPRGVSSSAVATTSSTEA